MPLFLSEQKSWPKIQFILRQTCGQGCCFFFFSSYVSKKVMNRLTRLFVVLSIQFPMTSCLISAGFLHSILYPNKVPWNLLNHWNQYSSPGLTPGYFCSGTPSSSWTLSTTLTFDSCPCFEILLLVTSFLCFWLMQNISCFSCLTHLARISSLFFFCVLLKTIWVLLRSASVWLSKVCLLENMQSWWMFFKIANAFLLK